MGAPSQRYIPRGTATAADDAARRRAEQAAAWAAANAADTGARPSTLVDRTGALSTPTTERPSTFTGGAFDTPTDQAPTTGPAAAPPAQQPVSNQPFHGTPDPSAPVPKADPVADPAVDPRNADPTKDPAKEAADKAAADKAAADKVAADRARAAAAAFGARSAGLANTDTAFTADNNLRGVQVNPGWTPQLDAEITSLIQQATITPGAPIAPTDLARARSALDRLTQITQGMAPLANQGVVAPTDYAPSAEAARARVLTAQGLETLFTAPDRQQILNDQLRLYDEQSAPVLDERLRSIVNAAAAAGRTRSGLTTNRLTDMGTLWRQERDQLGRGLMIDAQSQTLADRLANLTAAQNVAGQFRGEDLSEASFEQALREEQRAEIMRRIAAGQSLAGLEGTVFGGEQQLAGIARGDAESDRAHDMSVQQAIASLNLGKADALAGVERDRFGRETSMREETRAEREYQNRLAEQALQQRIAQIQLEDQLMNSDVSRRTQMAQALMGSTGLDIDTILALMGGG